MATKTAIKFSPVDIEGRKNLDIRPGSTIRVWQKIQEKGKTRLQAYEGLVIARKHGTEPGATITVRKVASGVGMEKIFPLYSPNIDKIEILKQAKVSRAKLYYIRDKAAKEIRRRTKRIAGFASHTFRDADELVEQVTAGVEIEAPIEAEVVEEKPVEAETK